MSSPDGLRGYLGSQAARSAVDLDTREVTTLTRFRIVVPTTLR